MLVVGRLSAEKGQAGIILAVSKILKLGLGWRLVIVGVGPELETIKKLVIQESCEGLVHFDGFIPDLKKHYRQAAVLIHNSSFEGFPNVIFEAMANGCPVVASKSSIIGLFEDITPLRTFESLDELGMIMDNFVRNPSSLDVLRFVAKQQVKKYHPDAVVDQWFRAIPSGKVGT